MRITERQRQRAVWYLYLWLVISGQKQEPGRPVLSSKQSGSEIDSDQVENISLGAMRGIAVLLVVSFSSLLSGREKRKEANDQLSRVI